MNEANERKRKEFVWLIFSIPSRKREHSQPSLVPSI
jgi:hypothetical protein